MDSKWADCTNLNYSKKPSLEVCFCVKDSNNPTHYSIPKMQTN